MSVHSNGSVKKYGSLQQEFREFVEWTEANGVKGIALGNGLYKARLAVKSKGKGKSGGLRIISYQDIILAHQDSKVYLVAIYDKSELASLEIKHITRILKDNSL